jgi:hypothetical protein
MTALLLLTHERREQRAAAVLALTVVGAAAAWIASPAVSYEARHVAAGTFAALPAAVSAARRQWPDLASLTRFGLVMVALLYLVLPWAVYAPVAAVTKRVRHAGYATTERWLYNPLLSAGNGATAIREARVACPDGSVWYMPEPLTALEFGGPMIITHADFEHIDVLRAQRYIATRPVCALLPERFEGSGKGDVIRTSFTGVTAWSAQRLTASFYTLWTGR